MKKQQAHHNCDGHSDDAARRAHIPVLAGAVCRYLPEVIDGRPREVSIVDGTFGQGGHFEAIVARLNAAARSWRYYGIDQDRETLEAAERRFAGHAGLFLYWGDFRKMDVIVPADLRADVILLDLGVNISQITSVDRGFSLYGDGPLDMRMNPEMQTRTAVDVVRTFSEAELTQALKVFTSIRKYRSAARKLKTYCDSRAHRHTTQGLIAALGPVLPPKRGGIHPATTLFQCLRILTNDEMGAIEEAVPKAIQLLKPGGRLMVISFHSVEHRLVKRLMAGSGHGKIICRKPVVPEQDEIKSNPSSRSAQLRVFEKE